MLIDPRVIRVDIVQIKDVIYQRIGPEKAKNYFDHLERFCKLEMSKVEFVKSCTHIIGRENLSLHNVLIRSILQNAEIGPKEVRKVEARDVKVANYGKSRLQIALDQAPRKRRSFVGKARKLKTSHVGPLGKSPSVACEESVSRSVAKVHKLKASPVGPLGKSPSVACEESVSRLQEEGNGAELPSLGRPLMVEDGEEVEQCVVMPLYNMWSSITAPIGVPLNLGGDRRGLHFTSLDNCLDETCQSMGELQDTNALGRRLQKKLGKEGVSISRDAANLLNKGLDVCLKRIISQCVGVSGAQCEDPLSGFHEVSPGQYVETSRQQNNISLLDFRVGMESNPRILGEDWSLQLEKISN